MKTYTIVAGVNGCGKSSLTGVLRTEKDNLGKIIDVAKITVSCSGNVLEGGKKAVALIDDCLKKRNLFYTGNYTFRKKDDRHHKACHCKGLLYPLVLCGTGYC